MHNQCLTRQYPLEASWTTPGRATLPLLRLWCQFLCTARQQILLPRRRLFDFVWLPYCWISKIHQLRTRTEKYQGWCKTGQNMHMWLKGVGMYMSKGEAAFSYRLSSDRVHFQRELETIFRYHNGMGNKDEYKKKNIVSFYKCKNYFSVSLKAYSWLSDIIYLQWDF